MKSRYIAELLTLAILIACLTACGGKAEENEAGSGIFPQVTSGGVLDLPWGCTFEEFAAEYEGVDYEVYDQTDTSGGKFVLMTRTIVGREIDYRLIFSSFEELTEDGNDTPLLYEADLSLKNEEDKEAVSAAITADMGEKITEHDTYNGNSYGIPDGIWVSGESVYNTLSEEQRAKALERGEENESAAFLLNNSSFYTSYPLSVTEQGTECGFTADARWGVILGYWLAG